MTKIFLSKELRLMLRRDNLKKQMGSLNEELVLCVMVKIRVSSRFSLFER